MKPQIPDSTITRQMLVAKLRRPKSAQNTLTRILQGATNPDAEAGVVLLSYEDNIGQPLLAPDRNLGTLVLDIATAVVTNVNVTTGPFAWTADTDRLVTVEAGVTLGASSLPRYVLAVRVNNYDVASSHYMRGDALLRISSDISLYAGDVVTLEMRAYNPLDCKASVEIQTAAIVVTSL